MTVSVPYCPGSHRIAVPRDPYPVTCPECGKPFILDPIPAHLVADARLQAAEHLLSAAAILDTMDDEGWASWGDLFAARVIPLLVEAMSR